MSGVSAAETTSLSSGGLPAAEAARGRRRAATAYGLVFVALVVALWGRLALPLTSAECRFAQQALRLLALDDATVFAADASDGEARALAHLLLQTGATERSLRCGVLLGLFLGGALLLETVRARRLSSGALLAAACAGIPAAADAELLRPAYLAFAPLCALVCALRAPAGFASGLVAAFVAAAGAAGATALEPRLGLFGAAVVLLTALCELRPTAVVRAAFAAAAAVAVARVAGFPLPPACSYVEPARDLSAWFLAGLLPGGGFPEPYYAGGAAAALLLSAALFAQRGRRAAVIGGLLALVVAVFGGGRLLVDGAALDALRAAAAALPLLLRFAAREAEEGPVVLRLLLAAAALAGAAAPFALKKAPAERVDPRAQLADLRAVSSTRDAAALSGPYRVGAAVYSRLGHDPNLRLLFVPETAPLDGIAAAARDAGAAVLWTDFDASDVPGLTPAEPDGATSRPSGLRRYAVSAGR